MPFFNFIRRLLLLLVLGACAPKDQGALKNRLVDASMGEPETLISLISGDAASAEIGGKIFESLLRYNAHLDLEPALAESWHWEDDGKTLVFKLKENMTWSDGAPLSANDVVFTINLVKNPKTLSPYSGDYEPIQAVTMRDQYTVALHYAMPFAPALASFAGLGLLPEHLLAGKDIRKSAFARRPVGAGYYTLKEWRAGERITLAANPRAALGPPKIAQWITRFMPDPTSQLLALQADELDMMSLTPMQYARVFPARKDLHEKFALYRSPGNTYAYLGFNLTRPPFNDVRVRQAINYAIDKESLIQGVLFGLGETLASPYPPHTRWANAALKPYAHDPQKAKALFEEAGFAKGRDGKLYKNGKKLAFTIITNQNTERSKVAQIIQKELGAYGIDVAVRELEWGTFLAQFIRPRNFEAVILGWSLSPDPDQYAIWHSSQQNPGQFNFIGYRNPKADELLEKGRLTLDLPGREAIYHEFAQVLYDDSPIVYLYAADSLSALNRKVHGIPTPPPPAGIGYNYYEWFIAPVASRNALTP
jgi:peptide/nickel transport system substrate-binding protein